MALKSAAAWHFDGGAWFQNDVTLWPSQPEWLWMAVEISICESVKRTWMTCLATATQISSGKMVTDILRKGGVGVALRMRPYQAPADRCQCNLKRLKGAVANGKYLRALGIVTDLEVVSHLSV